MADDDKCIACGTPWNEEDQHAKVCLIGEGVMKSGEALENPENNTPLVHTNPLSFETMAAFEKAPRRDIDLADLVTVGGEVVKDRNNILTSTN